MAQRPWKDEWYHLGAAFSGGDLVEGEGEGERDAAAERERERKPHRFFSLFLPAHRRNGPFFPFTSSPVLVIWDLRNAVLFLMVVNGKLVFSVGRSSSCQIQLVLVVFLTSGRLLIPCTRVQGVYDLVSFGKHLWV